MPQQLADILHAILDHCRPLQTQTPAVDPHVRRQAHRLQHLGSKHAAITNLHPLVQPIMIAKDFQAGFRVRIVGGLETQAVDPHFGEEDFHEADESSQSQAVVCYDTFDLVEFGEMGSVDAFVAKDAIDGEVACWMWVCGEFVKHVGGNGGGVGSKHKFERFVLIERVAVAYGAVLARLVDLFNVFEVLLVVLLRLFW